MLSINLKSNKKMKKFVFLLVALFSFSVVFAQDISYGLKAGVNYGATKTTDEDYNALFNPGVFPHFGAFAEFGFGEFFAIQPELNYFVSGFKGNGENTAYTGLDTGGIELNINNGVNGNLSYLQIPVMFKYYFTDALSLDAGPYISFLLSAKYDGKKTAFDVPVSDGEGGYVLMDIVTTYDKEDMKDEYNSMDYGLGVGATYNFDFGLNISARYNLGLADLDATDKGTASGSDRLQADYKVQNRIFQFTVGYKFM